MKLGNLQEEGKTEKEDEAKVSAKTAHRVGSAIHIDR